ncbi:MAG: ABC transporter permease [Candidatus Thermoplasmatota archaeon]|nr:ABC transporter permease [Candidatus Thermoplasmatota archaeon]MCL5793805.1 ABC transporter permease [Candidatus Thermoplasmatota archaeon]
MEADTLGQLEEPQTIRVPDSITQIGTITKYELLNYFRAKRFYVLLIIGLAISALLTFLVAYYRPESFLNTSLTFYSQWWGGSVTFVIILSAIFFGGDSISGEFQNKTGYYLVSRPVRRSSIYVGKWVASFIASMIMLLLFLGIAVANGVYYFGAGVPYQLWQSVLLATLYMGSVLSFTFFWSSLFKTSVISVLVTVILFLFAFPLIDGLLPSLVGAEPWFVITYGAEVITAVLNTSYPVHDIQSKTPIGKGHFFTITTFTPYLWEGIAIMLAYFVVSAVLGLFIFEKREFA